MQVRRPEFLSRLEAVAAGVSTQNATDQSSCVAFKDGRVMTFNDEVAVQTTSYLDKKFLAAVKAEPLLKILRKLPDETIDVTIQENELVVNAGSSTRRRAFGVTMEKEVTLPIHKVDVPTEWKPLHEDFAEAVTIVKEVATRDESRFLTTCIHIHPEHVEAFDNYQASRYPILTPVADAVLVRAESLRHVLSLDMTEFGETTDWLHFRNPIGLIFSCRRYLEKFKNLTPMFKTEGGIKVELPPGLAEAAERAEIPSSERKHENEVTVELRPGNPGKMRVRGVGDLCWYQESTPIEYDGPEMDFTISPKTLGELTKRPGGCVVTKDKLVVDGGKFLYMTALGTLDNGHGG